MPASLAAAWLGEVAKQGAFSPCTTTSQLGVVAVLKLVGEAPSPVNSLHSFYQRRLGYSDTYKELLVLSLELAVTVCFSVGQNDDSAGHFKYT